MKQHQLKPTPGSTRPSKRVGRGGKKGTYSGRGGKGQTARTGGGVRPGFEGGQIPLLMRMPKLKGFLNPNKVTYFAVNVGKLDDLFKEGDEVSAKSLVEKGMMKKALPIKLLGQGDLKKKLTIKVDLASKSAQEKVEKAGGSLTLS